MENLRDKHRAFKSKLAASDDKNERLKKQAEADKELIEKYLDAIKRKNFELDEMKLAIDGFQESMNHVSQENKRLSVANQELERKLRAEKAERMSMGNNSFVSAGMGAAAGGLGGRFGGGGAAKDILSRSILENSMAGGGNTSIMDIMTGHAAPTMKEIANRSMQMSKPREHSFVSSQKSFFSKKPA